VSRWGTASRLAVALGLATALAGCDASGPSSGLDPAARREPAEEGDRGNPHPDAPAGLTLVATGLPEPPALATLTAGIVPTPVALDVVRFVGAEGAAITRTLATFGSSAGALGAYNGWFARYGFPSVAVRTALPLGEAAERYDLGWPPLHAVLVRDGTRFVLVEGDDALPEATRAPALATLAAAALAEASGAATAGSGEAAAPTPSPPRRP